MVKEAEKIKKTDKDKWNPLNPLPWEYVLLLLLIRYIARFLREAGLLDKLRKKAEASENPIDDIAVTVLEVALKTLEKGGEE